ncbi:effector-associated domain 2-containing protein [Streptomyces sp. NPDC055099]
MPAAAGLEAARVAEVLVERPGRSPGRRGSGYRVGDRSVLTAAHVVAGPVTSLRVRFDADLPGEWSADVRVVLLAETVDLALLEITTEPPARCPTVESPRYGAVPEADVVLTVSAMGFPRFKLREDRMRLLDDGAPSQYRDSCHVSGTVSALSNRREGTLELAVLAPRADPEPERSPWEGMSGAAVWSGGAVVGVISAHHRSDGLGRLAAHRVEHWYGALTAAELERLHGDAGLPLPGGLASATEPNGQTAPPSLANLPPDLPLRELMPLVDALMALTSLKDPGSLALVLASIDGEIAANRPRDPRLRMDIYGIVHTCLRYRGTLDQLLETVRLLEGQSTEVAAVDREAAQLAKRYC